METCRKTIFLFTSRLLLGLYVLHAGVTPRDHNRSLRSVLDTNCVFGGNRLAFLSPLPLSVLWLERESPDTFGL